MRRERPDPEPNDLHVRGSVAHGKDLSAHNARFYAVQYFGKNKSVRLYNCPDCRSTISEQTLEEARRAVSR